MGSTFTKAARSGRLLLPFAIATRVLKFDTLELELESLVGHNIALVSLVACEAQLAHGEKPALTLVDLFP